MDEARLAEIERGVRQRAAYVVPRLLTSKTQHKLKGWGARRLWKWFGEKPLLRFVHASIEADMIRRDQLDVWSWYSANARAVLAELKAPGYDYRTIDGLDRAIHLDRGEIRTALADLAKTPNLLWSGQVNGQEC